MPRDRTNSRAVSVRRLKQATDAFQSMEVEDFQQLWLAIRAGDIESTFTCLDKMKDISSVSDLFIYLFSLYSILIESIERTS